jgi:ribosomal protein S18 acetylase RimI-like enzyme
MPGPIAPPSGIRLRDYRSGDAAAMWALDILCFEPVFRFSQRAMRRFAEIPGAHTLLAESGSDLAAFAIVQLEEQTGYVVTLDVAPPWRRHGLARRLMAEMETRIAAAGAAQMALHVHTGNEAAIRFYQAMGYHRTAHEPNFYAPGLDAFLYAKELHTQRLDGPALAPS